MKQENVFLILGAGCLIAGIITGIIARNINNFPSWVESIFVIAFVGFVIAAGRIEASGKVKKKESEKKEDDE
ncbi:MAG: hypothetical protein UU71_C0004G0017 [Parcubacteria group bacterium GW2011_GWB1_41_6]|nr:MAG: hypothetical protein UU71_C0004G0017 [Parcubacteria group bacterium GW2011_GWB1_41_6]KKS33938.1 MAG: hypothetical protein UU96_C0011G0016 [Parcubacteria group bacterium GW2011_GWC2_42_13]KKS56612.1 MAG: hypothetical protein UV22_C0028G0001 [Parcubacteria group bacterium GW2011_GWA2_42_35]